MKREGLKELGLSDEQIEKVMAENGRDIEKHKQTTEAARTELEGLRAQLADANRQIEAFKGMDVEGIKAAADEWKQKAEQAEADAKAQVERLRFDHALQGALASAKARNPKAVAALLETDKLKFADGELIGLREQLEQIRAENGYLFEEERPAPRFSAPTGNTPAPGLTREAFGKMGYRERLRLKEQDPEQYKTLKES